jgi:hypothetical protein
MLEVPYYLGCQRKQNGCIPARFTLVNDTCNPGWCEVYNAGGKKVIWYHDGEINVSLVNTNRVNPDVNQQYLPAEKFTDRGAISCYGNAFGGVVTNLSDRVQYWLAIELWHNINDGTSRNVQPSDVVIHSGQQPIVIYTNNEWQIRFKE